MSEHARSLASRLVTWAAVAGLYVSAMCDPKPAPRPRFTKQGIAFMPKDYSQFSAHLQQEFSKQLEPGTFPGPCIAFIEIASAKPKTTVKAGPRGDVDNHAKGPMDALTKTQRAWLDDDQVQVLVSAKRWVRPGEEPNIQVSIFPMIED